MHSRGGAIVPYGLCADCEHARLYTFSYLLLLYNLSLHSNAIEKIFITFIKYPLCVQIIAEKCTKFNP